MVKEILNNRGENLTQNPIHLRITRDASQTLPKDLRTAFMRLREVGPLEVHLAHTHPSEELFEKEPLLLVITPEQFDSLPEGDKEVLRGYQHEGLLAVLTPPTPSSEEQEKDIGYNYNPQHEGFQRPFPGAPHRGVVIEGEEERGIDPDLEPGEPEMAPKPPRTEPPRRGPKQVEEGAFYPNSNTSHQPPESNQPSKGSNKKSLADIFVSLLSIGPRLKERKREIIAEGNLREFEEVDELLREIEKRPKLNALVLQELRAIIGDTPWEALSAAAQRKALLQAFARVAATHPLVDILQDAEQNAAENVGNVHRQIALGLNFDSQTLQQIEVAIQRLEKANVLLLRLIEESKRCADYITVARRENVARRTSDTAARVVGIIEGVGSGVIGGAVAAIGHAGEEVKFAAKRSPRATLGSLVGAGVGLARALSHPGEGVIHDVLIGAVVGTFVVPAVFGIANAAAEYYKQWRAQKGHGSWG